MRATTIQLLSPAASFADCVMTLYLLKVHLQTFLSIPITQKCQILGCDTCRKWAMWRKLSWIRHDRRIICCWTCLILTVKIRVEITWPCQFAQIIIFFPKQSIMSYAQAQFVNNISPVKFVVFPCMNCLKRVWLEGRGVARHFTTYSAGEWDGLLNAPMNSGSGQCDRRRGSPVPVSRLVISRTHAGPRPLEDVDLLKPKTYFMYCTTSFNFQKLCVLPTMHLCVLRGSQNKQRLFFYTELNYQFL